MTNAQETNATVTAAYILIRRKLKLVKLRMIPVMGTVNGHEVNTATVGLPNIE